MKPILRIALVLSLLAATAALADDLTGSDSFLCTVVYATRCDADGECDGGPAWNFNIPQFIEVNLEERRLSTTKASGENRTTPIKNLERDEGMIILQGVQQGRAFSIVITEETGMASIAVAMDEQGILVSGVCTPMPGSN